MLVRLSLKVRVETPGVRSSKIISMVFSPNTTVLRVKRPIESTVGMVSPMEREGGARCAPQLKGSPIEVEEVANEN